jgi:hypothetical protein
VLPFEKDTIRFYKYFFEGYENPLIIEAKNKEQANEFLLETVARLPMMNGARLIDTKITTPIIGVTKNRIDKVDMIWVGKDKSENGWIPASQYLKSKYEK